jgi:hypothetical protein
VRIEGYSHPLYAHSLDEFGTPFLLQHSEGWLLEREIPGTVLQDLMGCYPIFSCQDWQGLARDIKEITNRYVSLVLVTDPFQDIEVSKLQEIFPDLAKPFKQHYIVDLMQDPWDSVSRHHRRNLRKAELNLQVEIASEPASWIDVWVNLYENIVGKYRLRGIQAFSKRSFVRLLQVPGVELMLAFWGDKPVGAQFWIHQGERAYNHLNALSIDGYELGAGFALYGFAIDYYKDKVQYLDIGGGAGFNISGTDGLAAFKRGWTGNVRMTYLCGRILNNEDYRDLVREKDASLSTYFPAYRRGEFIPEPVMV